MGGAVGEEDGVVIEEVDDEKKGRDRSSGRFAWSSHEEGRREDEDEQMFLMRL